MAWDDIPDYSQAVANSILQSVKHKDPFTFHHCLRVGKLSRKLAEAMGLNEFEQAVLEFSGLFHDIGKVGVPDEILLKAGRLGPEEIEVMKSHPILSAEVIEPLATNAFFRFLLSGIRCHHERIDGTGYPFNLHGERIPLSARIIAVVDSFDAMSNSRPYRNALSRDKVIKELVDFSNTQFDSSIVRVFLDALKHWDVENQTEDGDDIAITIIKKAA